MSGSELIRRDAYPLDERRHNRQERELLRRDSFVAERERTRQIDHARLSDEKSELSNLLGHRTKQRMAAANEDTRQLRSLDPDNLDLAMAFAEVDRLVNKVHLHTLLDFGQDS